MERNLKSKETEKWIKWMRLGKIYGCHQRADRSFFINGWQMPVCARCTGVILSYPLAVILFFVKRVSVMSAVIMSGIMFLDWFVQYIGLLPSTNKRRLITGLIGGFGVATLRFYIVLGIAGIIKDKLKRE